MESSLSLREVKPETHDTKSFIFGKPVGFSYIAGQYLRWLLPHEDPDERGIKRPFSLSSSPTEDFIMLTTKFAPSQGSSFKKALLELNPGASLEFEGPRGEFILPGDVTQPVVFLGGGVGITPFRSMIKFATDKKLPKKITLLYANKTPGDIIYKSEFDQWAEDNPNFKVAYTVDQPIPEWTGDTGYLTAELIKKYVADISQPLYFICGPAGMIEAYRQILSEIGVGDDQIRTENFSGYA